MHKRQPAALRPPIALDDVRRARREGGSPDPEKSRRRTIMVIALVAAAIVVAVGTAVDLAAKRRPGPTPTFVVAPVTRGSVVSRVRLKGVFKSEATMTVFAGTTGRVMSISVVPGQRVIRGHVLARLDPTETRAEIARVESQLVAGEVVAYAAEMGLARVLDRVEEAESLGPRDESPLAREDLDAQAALAHAKLVSATAEVAAREATLRASRRRLAGHVIRAPADGVILAVGLEPGQTAAPDTRVASIDLHPGRFQVAVSLVAGDNTDSSELADAVLRQVRVGQRATITAPSRPGRSFDARVVELHVAPHGVVGSGRSPELVLQVQPRQQESETLSAGLKAAVEIETESDPRVLRAPVSALRFAPPPLATPAASARVPGVWVFDSKKNQLRRVPVELGISDGVVAEVSSTELTEGAGVVVGLAYVK